MTEFPAALVAPADAIEGVLDRVDAEGGTRAWLARRGVSSARQDAWTNKPVVDRP